MAIDQDLLHLPIQQRKVVTALLQAKSVKEIAGELELSPNTVKDYLRTIYKKYDVHSARELMHKLL